MVFLDGFAASPSSDHGEISRKTKTERQMAPIMRDYKEIASRIADEDDRCGLMAAFGQVVTDGERIVERCRKRMFGRETVVEMQRRDVARPRDVRHYGAVRLQRPHDVSTAVEMDDDVTSVGACRDDPLRRPTADRHWRDTDVGRHRTEPRCRRIGTLPQRGDGCRFVDRTRFPLQSQQMAVLEQEQVETAA